MATLGHTVVLLSLLASLNAGCLLLRDPINAPPTVSIDCPASDSSDSPITCTGDGQPTLVRESIAFQATAADPDEGVDTLYFDWYVGKNCASVFDGSPQASQSGLVGFRFTPTDLGTGCVAVLVTDSHGANARAWLAFTVGDQAPVAELDVVPSPGSAAPGAGQALLLPLYAKVTLTGAKSFDPDTDDAKLDYHWSVFSGTTQLSMPGCPDPGKDPYACTFTTDAPGTYLVQLVVSDSSEVESAPVSQTIQVATDQLPNIVLDSVVPLPPFPPDDPPLQRQYDLPNTFTVNRVDDDGDPFPSGDPSMPYPKPPAGFVWFYQGANDASFNRLTNQSGASYTIPAKAFNPQDSIRLRVEYHDRVTACQSKGPGCRAAFLGSCDPSATVCYSSDQRAQWVTWTVVFR